MHVFANYMLVYVFIVDSFTFHHLVHVITHSQSQKKTSPLSSLSYILYKYDTVRDGTQRRQDDKVL